MKKIIFILLFLSLTSVFSQKTDSISVDKTKVNNFLKVNHLFIYKNEKNIATNKSQIKKLKKEIEELFKKMDSLHKSVKNSTNESQIKKLKKETGSLHKSVAKNRQSIDGNKGKVNKIDDRTKKANRKIDRFRLYWVIVIIAAFLLSGFIYIVYRWLKKRIFLSKTEVETQIKNTKRKLEEESIKLDNKLMEVLETQLKLSQGEPKKATTSKEEIDHSLALKVADEMIRIQKNLNQMDKTIKGLKQLKYSLKRIEDNFAAHGYELVDMLGKEYNDGMTVSANFVPSEDLDTGKKIITRIIKPQVNFKGKMIQEAQIEVSIGE